MIVLSRRILQSSLPACRHCLHTSAPFSWQRFENERHFEPGEDHLKRVVHGLTYDFKRWKRRYYEAKHDAFKRRHPIAHAKYAPMNHELLPFEADYVIIGGGLMGSSAAYWLAQRFRDEDHRIVVIENNDVFATSASMLSCGGITQQFSMPEHVELSMFSAEFMRHAGEHLRILDSEPPDINVLPMGFLFLARNDDEVAKMRDRWNTQTDHGARIALLNPDQLRQRFPFMVFDDVKLGSFGLENEGSIDAWQLLGALREKNITLGVHYVKGEVEGFEFNKYVVSDVHGYEDSEEADDLNRRDERLYSVLVRPQMTDASARPIRFFRCVNAAGPWAGKVARMAGIGEGRGLLSIPVTVEPRKRTVYVVHVPDGPGIDMPCLIDPSGVYCRQETIGNTFVCGKHPTPEEDAKMDHTSLSIDYDYFYERIWPVLAKRVPSFKNLKIKNAWAGYVDYNPFDENPIIGEHLLYGNFFTMAGFSGRGMQHAVAVGRAYAEKMYEDAYTGVNLRKFDMRRIMMGNRLIEDTKFM